MAQFFKCKKCGKIVEIVNKGCPALVCCGEEMTEIKANTSDGATEKHVPVIEVNGDKVTVKVGSAVHPMEADHWIQWIEIETDKGVQRKNLNPGEAPQATFILSGEKLLAAYEYCNKHGLWKAEA
ncbi:desulfoferrodoxin [Treponema sp.]|jgi:superoxide reductase|uniref:desulfoferrodoxin n=1 Tax=Treponema sp. TaxID=166 RepID=UPI0025E2CA01|nr:desulfoferrodoxin [Treponema sp.]MBR4321722.1 desulfoferrodoxin [Treponema sp.]